MSTVEIPAHRTHSLTVFCAHSLLYKHSVLMEKQVQWVCGHVCGETGGYLEQRQTLGVRIDPGWTLQLCVYQRVKVWLVSNSMTLLTSAGRCRNYTIWTQKASFLHWRPIKSSCVLFRFMTSLCCEQQMHCNSIL